MKHLKCILLIVTLLITSCSEEIENNSTYKVTRVIDGDTFWAVDENQNGQKIRLIGLDTPELSRDSTFKEFYAEEAKDFLNQLIYKQEIRLTFDKVPHDKFGRILAYVYLNDTIFVNELLIQKGFARTLSIPPNTKFARRFATIEQMAKAKRLGIWQTH